MVFEAAGSADGFRLAVEAVRPGGQVVWLGKVNVSEDVAFRWGALMGEKRITRIELRRRAAGADFPWLARAYLDGKLKLDELITARIPLEADQRGLRRAEARRGDPQRGDVRMKSTRAAAACPGRR